MEYELRGWTPTSYQQEKMELAKAYGVGVVDYTLAPQEALVKFAEQAVCELPEDWFWDGWEYGPTMFVALKEEEIVGYANYWPTPTLMYGPKEGYGGFGPIGVLEAYRGHGIGTWLLVECMLQVQKLGRTHIWANWVNTPFYLANGWRFLRQYTEFEKTLRT
jgi:GNAT superfamily N-acetyltransferase